MKSKYIVKKQSLGHLFSVLQIERESNSRSVVSKMNSTVIDEVLEDYKIDCNNINSIFTYRDKKKIKIEIEYCRVNIADYVQGTKEEQIRKLMELYGYKDTMIKRIKYCKVDRSWHVDIKPGYAATDDISVRGEKSLIENEARKILNFDIRVIFL